MKWEYMVCDLGEHSKMANQSIVLDAYGANGWELVTVLKDLRTTSVHGYFKRPVAENHDRHYEQTR